MPSGGARVVSGPAPDPGALSRGRLGDVAGWTMLAADGKARRVPKWPLSEQAARERVLWRELWRRPQSVMWERLDQRYEVAMFCRNLARAEKVDASVELQKVVRQYLDSLGLSVQGMLRNRWRLADPVAKPSAASAPAAARRPSARGRLTVVADDGNPGT